MGSVIVSAVRTPVGSYLGSLKTLPAHKLAGLVVKEAIERSKLRFDQVEEVVLGNVLHSSESPNVGRLAVFESGLPETVPGYSIDRQCGSALQAVVSAHQQICTGSAKVVVAGGVEMMSRGIYHLPGQARYEAFRMGNAQVLDVFQNTTENLQPVEQYGFVNMGITAENVAAKYEISRWAQDEFALHSQQKAKAAMEAGRFAPEIVPVLIPGKKGDYVLEMDEYPRPNTTLDSLAKLRPVFKKDGSVTAGNASGMNDGASAVVVMDEETCNFGGYKPLVRIVAHAVTGVDPRIMGIGPVSAIQSVLRQSGLSLSDIDLFEINEAFAAQSLGVLTELGMLPGTALYDRVNVNGGAIALGHALGSSGTRILSTLIYELKRRGGQFGIASLCIGGGQGIAMLVESVN